MKWRDDLAGRDEEESICWEHFIVIELGVSRDNTKSKCREFWGKRL